MPRRDNRPGSKVLAGHEPSPAPRLLELDGIGFRLLPKHGDQELVANDTLDIQAGNAPVETLAVTVCFAAYTTTSAHLEHQLKHDLVSSSRPDRSAGPDLRLGKSPIPRSRAYTAVELHIGHDPMLGHRRKFLQPAIDRHRGQAAFYSYD